MGCAQSFGQVVVAGVKLKILKANHNCLLMLPLMDDVVVAGVKLKILKANHNASAVPVVAMVVVVAGVKLKILKANHNLLPSFCFSLQLLLLV